MDLEDQTCSQWQCREVQSEVRSERVLPARGSELQGDICTYRQMSHVCKLKDLYGLKQAPRAFYAKIDGYLLGLGFTKSEVDSNLYYVIVEGDPLILDLYVDDLFLTGSEKLIGMCKEDLASKFEMKNINLLHYSLGLEVWQQPGEIFLGQGKYVEILRRFRMEDCTPMSTPMITNLSTKRF